MYQKGFGEIRSLFSKLLMVNRATEGVQITLVLQEMSC